MKVTRMKIAYYADPTAVLDYSFDYTHDKELILTKGNSVRITVYQFDDQGRITDINYVQTNGVFLYKISISYKGDIATMISYDHTVTTPHCDDSTIFSLATNGLATHSVSYGLQPSDSNDTTWYTWNDHDLVKVVSYWGSNIHTNIITYDSGINPLFITDLPIPFYTFHYDYLSACSKHNIMEMKDLYGVVRYKADSLLYNSDNYLIGFNSDMKGDKKRIISFELIPK